MKKTFLSLVAFFGIIAVVMVTSGCDNATTVTDTNNTANTTNGQQQQMMDNRPDREADVSGIVKSIVGNEVTVTQVDMDAIREQMMANSTGETGTEAETGTKTNNFVAGSGGQMPPSGGGMGGPPGGGPGGEGSNSDLRDQMNELMRANSLGDVKVLIPVGIPMYTRGAEASLADLKVESNITIWLDQTITDRKIAEFVTL